MVELKHKLQQRDPEGKPSHSWQNLSAESVLGLMQSSAAGLSTQEMTKRLQRFGPNTLNESEPVHPFVIFLGQFNSLVVWLLSGAGVVSGILGEWIDCIAILTIVVLNAIIGFIQEYKAERAIEALKKMTSPRARVRRDGIVTLLSAAEIVPGDIIELEAGDLISADARLLDAASLKCIEAALTGESDAVNKRADVIEQAEAPLGNRRNMVFMGTSTAAGAGLAVAVATGMGTEFGRIAGLLQEASFDESTPLQERLAAVTRMLVWASLGIVGVIFILGLLRSIPVTELFLTSVSLAVAAVPEGLPAVVTVALALGVQRMARRRALIRKLPAVETLGSTSVICSDKTGTLTYGEMTVRNLYTAEQNYTVTDEGYGPNGQILFKDISPDDQQAERLRLLLTLLVGCNSAHLSREGEKWSVIGDPTEGALLTVGMKFGLEQSAIQTQFPRIREYPFDSERKRMTVIRRMPDEHL